MQLDDKLPYISVDVNEIPMTTVTLQIILIKAEVAEH